MNGLIAIGGLHRAHDDPSKGAACLTIATELMDSGLSILHSWSPDTLESEGADALIAYASLVAIYAIALPAVQYRRQPPEDPLGKFTCQEESESL